MKEKLLLSVELPRFQDLQLIDFIVSYCYKQTGNKFTVSFNGSKGYLSNIEISCEGFQEENNQLFIENLRNKNGSLKKIPVNIFYSEKNGVRISTGKDEPKVILQEDSNEDPDLNDPDLPF